VKIEELNSIVERSKTGDATLSDVVAICAATIESVSKHGKRTREVLGTINQTLEEMSRRLDRLEKHSGSPLWQLGFDQEEVDAQETTIKIAEE
jgi:hypothetical protein